MARQIEGSKARGYLPTLKQHQGTDLLHCNKSVGRTQKQTAEELGISQPAVAKAIKIATAVEEHPDLAGKPGQQVLAEHKRRKVDKPVSTIAQPNRRKQVKDLFERYSLKPTLAPKVAKAVIKQPERPVIEIMKEEVPSLSRMMEVRKNKETSMVSGAYTDAGGALEAMSSAFDVLPSLPKSSPDLTAFVIQIRKFRSKLNDLLIKLGFPDEETNASKEVNMDKKQK